MYEALKKVGKEIVWQGGAIVLFIKWYGLEQEFAEFNRKYIVHEVVILFGYFLFRILYVGGKLHESEMEFKEHLKGASRRK
jgi:hypothetical protein